MNSLSKLSLKSNPRSIVPNPAAAGQSGRLGRSAADGQRWMAPLAVQHCFLAGQSGRLGRSVAAGQAGSSRRS